MPSVARTLATNARLTNENAVTHHDATESVANREMRKSAIPSSTKCKNEMMANPSATTAGIQVLR